MLKVSHRKGGLKRSGNSLFSDAFYNSTTCTNCISLIGSPVSVI